MKQLEKLYAFLADNGPEVGEGIIAGIMPGLGTTPLVTGKESNVKLMLPLAKAACEQAGTTFKIVEFSVRNDVTGDYTPSPVATDTAEP